MANKETFLGLRQLWRTWKEFRCEHRMRAADIRIVENDLVACRCLDCGRVVCATYGLALRPKEWVK